MNNQIMPMVIEAEATDLTIYDPVKGLKNIAVAESAERMFARAKDATALYEALAVKLREQRNFVVWWDGLGDKRGRPEKTSETANVFPTIETLGLTREAVHRWRKRLKDEAAFDRELDKAHNRCVKIAEFQQGGGESYPKALSTGENEWYTPDEHLRAARDVLGEIDLDPASSEAAQQKVQATRYFTKRDNGLEQEWQGRVWLNPPYAQPYIAEFVSKMVSERRAGRVTAGLMLTHNYTDTSWFHEAVSIADAICFTRGRVKFYDTAGAIAAPTQGQAFFYFGADVPGFATRFRDVGFIVTPFTGEV